MFRSSFVLLAALVLVACEEVSEATEAEARAAIIRQETRAAFAATSSRFDHVSAEIWTDPNGCQHYLGQLENGEGYIEPLTRPDGTIICN